MPSHVRENFFRQYVIPALIGLAASASMGAFTLVWNLSTKVALIESRQWVGREEFATVKAELAQTKEDVSRLREWMKMHAARAGQEAYPAAAPAAPYGYAARPPAPADAAAETELYKSAPIFVPDPKPTPTPKPNR